MNVDSTIPWSKWPSYDSEQIDAVVRALETGEVNYWNGQVGKQFERDFADWVGTRHSIAVANGSVALDLILEALDIGPGHDVVLTPRSYVASAHCVVRRGARPIFADVDRDSQNVTAESIRAALTPQTRALIAVHLAGWPCDMPAINALARERELFVIEDCAQAHGAQVHGKNVGTFGNAAAFSFCTDKIMTTGGEGGVVTVSDPALFERMWSIKDHGKNRGKTEDRSSTGTFKWLVDDIGTNYRMPELQAAIAAVQLRRVDDWLARRRANAAVLDAGLGDTPGLRMTFPAKEFGTRTTNITHSSNPSACNTAGVGTASCRKLVLAACPAVPVHALRSTTNRPIRSSGWRPPSHCQSLGSSARRR